MSSWISALDLWVWPTVALGLFLSAAVALACRIARMGRREHLQNLAHRVLQDDPVPPDNSLSR